MFALFCCAVTLAGAAYIDHAPLAGRAGISVASTVLAPGYHLGATPPAAEDAPVVEAAARGDIEEVRALLRAGADVNAAQGDGMTALHWAAMRGDAEMAAVLLYAGANLESATRLGAYTPLHLASQAGRAEAVGVLLKAGAAATARTSTGVTPLHFAAAGGDAATVEALLRAGVEVDAQESAHGQTPLHFAAAHGRAAAVLALIAAGADLSIPSNVVDFVERAKANSEARSRRREVLAAVRKAEAEARGETVEDAAATRTDTPSGQEPTRREAADRAQRDQNAPPAEPDQAAPPPDQGQTDPPPDGAAPPPDQTPPPAERDPADPPPDQAAPPPEQTDPPPPDRAAPPPPDQTPPPGNQADSHPPDQAAPPSQSGQAELPPDEAATPPATADSATAPPGEQTPSQPQDEPDDAEEKPSEEPATPAPRPLGYSDLVGRQGGMRPLHYAVREGHAPVVESLLEGGADINGRTAGDESTPLVVAVVNGHYDLAAYLLQQGADPTLASEDGVAPLYATIANRWAPKALYPQPTAFRQQKLDYMELMEMLLAAGADPDARVNTHIWYSAYNFDLLGVNFSGATPFWRAAKALDIPAMRMLVAAGADPHMPTKKAPSRRRRSSDNEEEDPSGLPPAEVGGPDIPPLVAAAGYGYGRSRTGNQHRHAPDSWLATAKYLVEELGADVNGRDADGFGALHYAAARGDNELIEYLVGKGADPLIVARSGQTTVDMANGPIQRVQPFFETIALLEGMGAKNNHKCLSC